MNTTQPSASSFTRALFASALIALSACGSAPRKTEKTKPPATVQNSSVAKLPQSRGLASWYGQRFKGRRTASGERFNPEALTAAHRTLPFGTRVSVSNVKTGQKVIVTINDRGPYSGNRIIDLSQAAARKIGLERAGVAQVELNIISL